MSNAAITAALEAGWAAIQAKYTDLPHVRIVLGSGSKENLATGKGQYQYHGHHWPQKWHEGDATCTEVMIASEHLFDGAPAVFATLIHEAVHALARARGIQDTSRQGRWHNGKFAKLAEECGLTVEKNKRIGHTTGAMVQATAEHYAVEVKALETAMGSAYRVKPRANDGQEEDEDKPKWVVLACSCDRKLKIKSDDHGEMGEIHCHLCESPFVAAA